MTVKAGTTSADYGLAVNNQANSLTFFKVRGDGIVQAADDGGTLQTVGWRGTPINNQTGAYTLVPADRGKCVQLTGGSAQTITVPSGVFSAGDVVTITAFGNGANIIAQGASMTLFWGNGGATTGNRTLTTIGIATIQFMNSTQAVITGSGLS